MNLFNRTSGPVTITPHKRPGKHKVYLFNTKLFIHEFKKMNRRIFLRNMQPLQLGLQLQAQQTCTGLTEIPEIKNKLPRWKGFNLLDLFPPTPPEP
jgi:hypothetical protein